MPHWESQPVEYLMIEVILLKLYAFFDDVDLVEEIPRHPKFNFTNSSRPHGPMQAMVLASALNLLKNSNIATAL